MPLEFKHNNEQHQGQEQHEEAEDLNVEELESLLRGSSFDEDMLPALPMPELPAPAIQGTAVMIQPSSQYQARQPLQSFCNQPEQSSSTGTLYSQDYNSPVICYEREHDGESSSSCLPPPTPNYFSFTTFDETNSYNESRSTW